MKSELDKCLEGEVFNCSDEELLLIIRKARALVAQYNSPDNCGAGGVDSILNELLGSLGNNVLIDRPFYCDYGRNIFMGDNVIVGINCVFVDCNKIEIGNSVLIASNVQICTATHPVEVTERLIEGWDSSSGRSFFRTYSKPIRVEDNVWIGGNVVILPGVTIGKNSVIGAGSVVVRSIPPDSLAVGNPCRVIRKINAGEPG